jgi:hypothetical protein
MAMVPSESIGTVEAGIGGVGGGDLFRVVHGIRSADDQVKEAERQSADDD